MGQSKRIIFYSWDAIGHINPFISIAKELKARGHWVCFVTSRELPFKDAFESIGLEFFHCIEAESKPEDVESKDKNISNLGELKELFRLGPRKAFTEVYKVDSGIGKRLEDAISNHDVIEEKLRSLRPDFIIFDTVHGIPCTTYVAPKWGRLYSSYHSILYSNFNDNLVAGMGLTRDEMNLPGMKQFEIDSKGRLCAKVKQFFESKGQPTWEGAIDLSPTSPYINFCLGPDELSLDNDLLLNHKLDKTWFRLEHTIDEDKDSETNRFVIPEKIVNLPGKLIYFSLGTLVTSDTEMINRLLSLLSKSKHKFIVSMGHLHQEIVLHENMWGQKYLNQKALLQMVDLFITHGGHNSIIEAFYYGVPGLIVLPVFADQFDLAQRVQECGFGKRLSPYDCTEQELLDAIDEVTSINHLPESMKSISSRLKAIEYHKIAADKIELILSD